jgi:hypothetical protein
MSEVEKWRDVAILEKGGQNNLQENREKLFDVTSKVTRAFARLD